LEGGDRTDIFLSDRTIYLEGDRTSKGGSSDLEVNILGLEGSDRYFLRHSRRICAGVGKSIAIRLKISLLFI